jgi:hypothetical protein
MASIISTLGSIGLLMDYEAFKENGPIRDFISKSCNLLNIGTTEAEVKEYIANYFGIKETELIFTQMLDVDGFDAEKIMADAIKELNERYE